MLTVAMKPCVSAKASRLRKDEAVTAGETAQTKDIHHAMQ